MHNCLTKLYVSISPLSLPLPLKSSLSLSLYSSIFLPSPLLSPSSLFPLPSSFAPLPLSSTGLSWLRLQCNARLLEPRSHKAPAVWPGGKEAGHSPGEQHQWWVRHISCILIGQFNPVTNLCVLIGQFNHVTTSLCCDWSIQSCDYISVFWLVNSIMRLHLCVVIGQFNPVTNLCVLIGQFNHQTKPLC